MKKKTWYIIRLLVSLILGTIIGSLHFFGAVKKDLGIGEESPVLLIIGAAFPILWTCVEIRLGLLTNNEELKTGQNKLNSLGEITKEIAESSISLGLFKKIESPRVWEFEAQIWGWNPNWSLELQSDANTHIADSLKTVHLNRLTNPKTQEINYIFLEGYELRDENGHNKDMQYGYENFLQYLSEIAPEKDLREKAEKKYKVWKIPYSEWSKNGQYHERIKTYRDFIVIKGIKDHNEAAILFFNFPWCLNGRGHEYLLELSKKNSMVENIGSFLKKLTNDLEKTPNRHKKVKYNNTIKKYELV